ncbi:hypothetical protein WJX73_006651 [Symbiochloris irregularis]|uniref:Uncharacterized protein n=1 Tax=Symbiochloris irregularis TaxID=706552 RepID=A0AAW1PHY4_9CHLO
MSSFNDWVPVLRGRSQPSREDLLDEESLLHGEEADVTTSPELAEDAPERQLSQSKPSDEPWADLANPLMRREVPAAANPIAYSRPWKEERPLVHHGQSPSFRYAPDRGEGYYADARSRFNRPCLLQTGRHAGRSRVQLVGLRSNVLTWHFWKRDFFTSCINVPLPIAILIMLVGYSLSFMGWACVWYGLYRWDSTCITGFEKRYGGFVSAFQFATETQQTIGYGFRAPNDCWMSAWMVVIQSVWGQLLDAVVLGVIFARISHPKQRARTIFMSDSAVIARRDGVLKFMFRVGDVRVTQVVEPKVRAILYTWGPGRYTAEGEQIPVRMETMTINYPTDVMLLLPVICEHTIDERSPLYGLTHDALTGLGAEVVVALDAATEHGDQFMTTHSYLPSEIHWGFTFVNIIKKAEPPSTHHTVDIGKFHAIEPQREQQVAQPFAASKRVTTHPQGAVPYPALHENTLCISDHCVVAPYGNSLALMFRVGDVYPNNVMEVHVRVYLYRWRDMQHYSTDDMAYELEELDVGYEKGRDRLMLRLPVIVRHIIDADSPLASWHNGTSALAADADTEIYVAVEGVHYRSSFNLMRRRTYTVNADVKWLHTFEPIVSRASRLSHGGKPRVRWAHFHTTRPITDADWERMGYDVNGTATNGEAHDEQDGQHAASALEQPAAAWNAARAVRLSQAGNNAGTGSNSVASSVQAPQAATTDDGDEDLSTRTISSPHNSWREKRSLMNMFRRPSEDVEDENVVACGKSGTCAFAAQVMLQHCGPLS